MPHNDLPCCRVNSNMDMSAWLDDYALGELWEKNILGARP
jgi:hypothetical protein